MRTKVQSKAARASKLNTTWGELCIFPGGASGSPIDTELLIMHENWTVLCYSYMYLLRINKVPLACSPMELELLYITLRMLGCTPIMPSIIHLTR